MKKFLKCIGYFLIGLFVITIIGGIYLTITNHQEKLAQKASWHYPKDWNLYDQLMLDDCVHRWGWKTPDSGSLPNQYDTSQKYVFSYMLHNKQFRAISYTALTNFTEQNIEALGLPGSAPMALGPQVLICTYDVTTYAYNGSIISQNGEWVMLDHR